jgi:AAA+ superfamily predicted ATPase
VARPFKGIKLLKSKATKNIEADRAAALAEYEADRAAFMGGLGMTRRISPAYLSPISECGLFETIDPDKTLSDMVLAEENRQKIGRAILEFSNWDILMRNGTYPIRRLLFYGPPGCGKTVAAGAIAAEIGLPFLYARLDALIGSYLGETARNIRKVFDHAGNGSHVVFFDEFDAIARSRDDNHEHGEIKRVVNTLLQQMDMFEGRLLVITATNLERSLDYAIWRRFDDVLRFDMPKDDERERLFNLRLKRFKGKENIIAEFLDDMGNFSHADVEKAAFGAIKLCVLDGRRTCGKKDVEQAVHHQSKMISLRMTLYQGEAPKEK